jgi:lipopolysaccharide cholinephosphotransferase
MGWNKEPYLIQRNLSDARKLLFSITSIFDQNRIPYHLEGGALLGIVRDKDLLPWDNDIDISIPSEAACELPKLKLKLLFLGYRLSVRKSLVDAGPIKRGAYSIFKIKPLLAYCIRWFIPNYESIVMDIFIKTKDKTHTYWQAKDKVMRVENKFYQSFETVVYDGQPLKAPNQYKDYLTQKYGDWSVAVKDWDCAKNELTIYGEKVVVEKIPIAATKFA